MLCIRYAPVEVPWLCCVPKSGKTRGFVYFHTQIRVFMRKARNCHDDVLARNRSRKDIIMTNSISLKTTLRELMNMVPDMTNSELPTPRTLRENAALLIQVDFSDGALEVYDNGFFIYTAKQRRTVVRVHDCIGDYYYEYADGSRDDFSEDHWMEAPFSAKLLIEGERHLDMNFDRRVRKYLSYYDAFDFDLIVFPDLANNVLKGKTIKNIALKFVSSSAGRSGNKTLHIYTTTKNTSGGTSTAWISSANKAGTISATFYNNTKTFYDLATTNAGLFEKLKAFLENGGQSFGIFVNESVTSSSVVYSTNYLSFTKVQIQINYEEGNIRYHNGTEWVSCIPYYHNGTEFVQCEAHYFNGTEWKK